MKKYYLKWTVEDEDDDYDYRIEVDGPADSIYGYPEMEYPGGMIKLVEVDTETNEETVLEKMILVDMQRSIETFGDQVDNEGRRTYFMYLAPDIVAGVRIIPENVKAVPFETNDYWQNYEARHQEWLKAHGGNTEPGGNE